MNIFKQHINNYIECPYLFAKNILANRYNNSISTGPQLKFRTFITEIVSYEMKNNCKMELSEYRVAYTNKFYTKTNLGKAALSGIIPKLNNIFSVFADNIFLGYNVPVEIVIPGTSSVYKDSVSFIMSDLENSKIIIIELEDLTNIEKHKSRLKDWAHYYTVYSYLAYSFNKKVDLLILDPISGDKIEQSFLPDRYQEDLAVLKNVVIPLENNVLYKNFYNCDRCELIGCE